MGRKELKKKKKSCIEGRDTQSNLQNTCGKSKRGSSKRHLNLLLIEEEREDNNSPAPSMVESEHRNNSNQSGSRKETKYNLILTVNLLLRLYAQRVLQDLG